MNRRDSLLLTVCALALTASTALAAVKVPDETPGPLAGPTCDVTGYTVGTGAGAAIPDNDPAGVTLAAISFSDPGAFFTDVIVGQTGAHTWVGDLIGTLTYDIGCDGSVEATAQLYCRPRGTNATAPVPCGTGTGFGCSGDLATANELRFGDDSVTLLASGACPNPIAAGCYKPNNPLSVFDGLPVGGCFKLNVSDNAASDTGAMAGWTVYYTSDRPVPVANRTWGQVKSFYR